MTRPDYRCYVNLSRRIFRYFQAIVIPCIAYGLRQSYPLRVDAFEKTLSEIRECFAGGGYEFPVAFLGTLYRPLVYVFLRDDEALYVGFSAKGIERPANPKHDQQDVIADCNRLCVYPCISEEAARKVEAALIFVLKPKHNVQGQMGAGVMPGLLGVTPGGYRLTYRATLNTTSESL